VLIIILQVVAVAALTGAVVESVEMG
jgi:hypothetical protein